MRPGRRATTAAVVCALATSVAGAAPARAAAPAEGGFIDVGGKVWRIVGGAPVRVSTWGAVGGPHRAARYPASVFDALPDYPRDGTFVSASDGRAYRFAGGAPFYISTWKAFGGPRPTTRIDARAVELAGAPPDSGYGSIRAWTYDLLGDGLHVPAQPASPLPLNGTLYVRGVQSRRIYKMVGGAPIWLPSWASAHGPKPYVDVDQAAIDHAGGTGPWRFVRRYPPDGWVVQGERTGQAYVVAGGAPVYIGTRAFLRIPDVSPPEDRVQPAVIDQLMLDHAGKPSPYDSLSFRPAPGTLLTGRPLPGGDPAAPWRTYRVTEDHLVETAGHEPGEVTVDQAALDQAGQDGMWSHLPPPGCAATHAFGC